MHSDTSPLNGWFGFDETPKRSQFEKGDTDYFSVDTKKRKSYDNEKVLDYGRCKLNGKKLYYVEFVIKDSKK